MVSYRHFRPTNVPYHTDSAGWQPQEGDDQPFAHPEAYDQWRGSGRPPPYVNPSRDYSYQEWRSNGYVEYPSSRDQYYRPDMSSSRGYDNGRDWAYHQNGYADGSSYRGGMQTRSYHSRSPPSSNNLPSFPPTMRDGPSSASSSRHVPQHRQHPSSATTSRHPSPPRSTPPPPPPPARDYNNVPKPPFVPFLPPPEYLELSKPSKKPLNPDETPTITPKLLVLDLNGALIYRTERSASRRAYPRPYLGCFLEYLFSARPDGETRPWEVFVWSSAQPHNVRAMVELGFGSKWIEGVYEPEDKESEHRRKEKGEGRLLGVWARDKMGLNSRDYGNKVQTFKDLRKVHEHLANPPRDVVIRQPPVFFDERTTVLLDDSPLKAIYQPWNQLVIPEYDKAEFSASKAVIHQLIRDAEASTEGCDEILLAVIGILRSLETVDNVPAWVRAGGLIPDLAEMEDNGLEGGLRRMSVNRDVSDVEPSVESLPSHHEFLHWYAIPEILEYWVKAGKAALEERNIAVDHGLNENGASRDRPEPPSPSPRPASHSAAQSTAYRQRAWSPSVPTSPPPGTARRSPTPSRRGFSTNAVAGPSTAQAEDGPIPRIPKGVKTDSWRTFRAYDVGLYLRDVADRVTHYSPLNEQNRHLLKSAAALLESISPDPVYEEGPKGWGLLCVECTGRRGEEQSRKESKARVENMDRLRKEQWGEVKVNDRKKKKAAKQKASTGAVGTPATKAKGKKKATPKSKAKGTAGKVQEAKKKNGVATRAQKKGKQLVGGANPTQGDTTSVGISTTGANGTNVVIGVPATGPPDPNMTKAERRKINKMRRSQRPMTFPAFIATSEAASRQKNQPQHPPHAQPVQTVQPSQTEQAQGSVIDTASIKREVDVKPDVKPDSSSFSLE